MLGESLACRLTLRFVQAVDRLGRVTLDSNKSKDKKESWLSNVTHRPRMGRLYELLSKMPLLLVTNQIVKDRLRLASHYSSTFSRVCFRQTASLPHGVCQWTEAEKAGLNPSWNWAALPASGHLQWRSTDELVSSFGGIAKYNGPVRPCQTRAR